MHKPLYAISFKMWKCFSNNCILTLCHGQKRLVYNDHHVQCCYSFYLAYVAVATIIKTARVAIIWSGNLPSYPTWNLHIFSCFFNCIAFSRKRVTLNTNFFTIFISVGPLSLRWITAILVFTQWLWPMIQLCCSTMQSATGVSLDSVLCGTYSIHL